MPSINDQLQKAWQQLQGGNTHGALGLIETVLQRAPANPQALCLLGMARVAMDDAANAVAPLERALESDPRNGMALDTFGLALLTLARYGDAAEVLRRAAALPHAPAVVFMRLGMALLNLNDATGAVQQLTRAVKLAPAELSFRLNLARALFIAGDAAAAREQFQTVLQGSPDELDAREGYAQSCVALGRLSEALPHLRFVANAEPENSAAAQSLASALFETGLLDEAETVARRVITLAPDAASGYMIACNALFIKGNFDEALTLLEQGYQRTNDGELLGLLTFQYRQVCDWPKWRASWEKLAPLVDNSGALGSPFWLLCEPITPAQQRRYTEAWAQVRYQNIAALPPAKRAPRGGRRLRIGYLSSDFQEHAAAYLIADMIEHHDRSRFEIFAYSHGPQDSSAMRRRLMQAFEHFVDIAWETDDAAAARIRADEIDILVEVKGYTVGDRITIMARRPCDIQVTWLGYPGTLGAPFVDYLIADPYIIGEGEEATCTERVLRLPHAYQPNDRKRTIAEPLTRAAYGLPEQGFVFCCFNQAYKITPEVFAVWMRLLQTIAGSVLWLVEGPALAKQNLLREAQAQGIAGQRIIFAERKPYAEHLARYKVADLALDTFPYTSHTTLSDALWCGCPTVGLRGDTFAARVSGSLLTAANLPDLITHNVEDYEQLACLIATTPGVLHSLRASVAQARANAPLFDTAAFARGLEFLYEGMVAESLTVLTE
jgi:protein O-GlcNAc transferase